ncbi:hypothetical protein bmyco0002_54090 [Bacillus pseudomycoides]|nr:hypothetical protein [Bacillus pseudomycoides]EEM02260.1 hypothetical protein bmyco0002_54090 [Bacillus pseudomycoides]
MCGKLFETISAGLGGHGVPVGSGSSGKETDATGIAPSLTSAAKESV